MLRKVGDDFEGNPIFEGSIFPVCRKCRPTLVVCNKCATHHFKKNIPLKTVRTFICSDCVSDFFLCKSCGKIHNKEFKREVEDKVICSDCERTKTRGCTHCGGMFFKTNLERRGSHTLCMKCSEDFVPCDSCGTIVHDSTLNEVEADETDEDLIDFDDIIESTIRICNSCHRAYRDRHAIVHSWNYMPMRFNYFKTKEDNGNPRFYGLELEFCTNKPDSYRFAEKLQKKFDKQQNYFYMKTDGSLPSHGLELVTHPMSRRFWKSWRWDEILKWLVSEGCTSHDGGSCGIHIHTAKNIGEINEVKLGCFINEHSEFVQKVARRGSVEYTRYKRKGSFRRKRVHTDTTKYNAINFGRDDTIELRIFRGSLLYNSFISSVEFYDLLLSFLRVNSIVEIVKANAPERFVDYVLKHRRRYNELYQYFVRRRLCKRQKSSKEIDRMLIDSRLDDEL